MKTSQAFFTGIFLLVIICAFTPNGKPADTKSIEGFWKMKGENSTALIVNGYFSQTYYDKAAKTFGNTSGGTISLDGNTLRGKFQFASDDKARVGTEFNLPAEVKGNTLTISIDGNKQEWERVEGADKNLAGVWRITQRENEGKMNAMPLQARRTLKILSDGHFQWIAINIETGEFSGTGGGSYTFKNGKYTENIEFFSRDNTRVGASLSFDGQLKGDDWHHKGKSSKGDPIHEVWSKFDASK
ncbi:MAG: membrane or secreted protein [Mucilaginibacter polytrichastri]|nr:membrane or secreted protein [Mucilaginibacter polytrichastri]